MLRPGKLVPDQLLPATLNVGYVIPTVIQAYYYNKTVPVDSTTLVVMIGASVIGAWLGAPIVAAMPRRKIQIGMGVSLLLFVVIAIMGQPQIGLLPTGGDALALTGGKLAFAAVANFTLGALMTLGIGLYGPCMILIYMLGMRPTAAFPIMMGSCAFLMPLASVRFLRTQAYEPKAILAMLLPGIPAVLIAATMVTNFPKNVVSWLVVVVVTYTAVNLLRAARREKDIASVATIAETQPAGD
jgi:putative Ca2+/H+ antiporter (TMEM165/GDT1 family)